MDNGYVYRSPSTNKKHIWFTVSAYSLFATLWILGSDWLLFHLQLQITDTYLGSLAKGLGFVFFTACVLFLIMRSMLQKIEKAQQTEMTSRFNALNVPDVVKMLPVVTYILETDEAGKQTRWVSENVSKLFGYQPEQILQKGWRETHIHPEDKDKALMEFYEIQGNGGGQIEYRLRHRNGDYRYILEELTLIKTNKKSHTRYIGVLNDITDTQMAQLDALKYAQRVEKSMFSAVNALAQLIEIRDPYTAGHGYRVGNIAAAIAQEMGYNEYFQQGMQVAGILHDTGKVGVPTELLTKPTALTKAEYEVIKEHALHGYNILKGVDFPWPIADIIYQHHERIDGSGYPRNLTSDQIIIEAKIIAVADVIESIATDRPYRFGQGLEYALNEIEINAGKLYDPGVAKACLRLFREHGYQLPEKHVTQKHEAEYV